MLRLAAKSTARYVPVREASGSGAAAGSGLGKKLFIVTALGTGAVGGVVGYSAVNPEFRKSVEDTVPQAKDIFDATIGPASKNGVAQRPAVVDTLNKKVAEVTHKVTESLHKVTPELPPAPVKVKPEIIPVDVKKPVIPSVPKKVTPAEVQQAAKEIEAKVIAQLETTQQIVKKATDAKIATIKAINDHAKTIKAAVDAGSKGDWDSVRAALENSEKLARVDIEYESKSRSALDDLKKIISAGKHDVASSSAPILVNSRDTADKLAYQLDELNQMINGARNESRVFNQYKDLIDRSRQQFAQELKAVVPNVDIHAKEKKLSEEELNALIAHAHLRVDQLKRQLTEQQLLEEKSIAKALEEQRRSDASLSKTQLELELRRVKEISNVELEKKLRDERSTWESELEERLKRAAAAHADNLEGVIRTQKQIHDIENAQAVDEAVEKERRFHSKQVELALEKLRGIETALESRVALDAENRRSKQYWLACQNLNESIVFGLKSGSTIDERRKPLDKELSVIGSACEDDPFVKTLISTFPEVALKKGVYTEQDLKQRFKQVYNVAFRIGSLDENGGSLTKYVSSWLQSLFIVEIPRQYKPEDKLSLEKVENRDVLARAKFFVDNGDFLNAVRVIQLLEGPAARVAGDWIADTRQHLEARFLVGLLLSHASVSSIRSTY